jgi:hypothetical protein
MQAVGYAGYACLVVSLPGMKHRRDRHEKSHEQTERAEPKTDTESRRAGIEREREQGSDGQRDGDRPDAQHREGESQPDKHDHFDPVVQ